ncbi:hypothetical protein AA0120_g11660 [Alternaria tenuissima]|nr:hypothetical protein AA0120_g11660 [Alternaria tenuissima]RYO55175.1 hypothetical protein AA0116_g9254 [Alternaria tenuissima]
MPPGVAEVCLAPKGFRVSDAHGRKVNSITAFIMNIDFF